MAKASEFKNYLFYGSLVTGAVLWGLFVLAFLLGIAVHPFIIWLFAGVALSASAALVLGGIFRIFERPVGKGEKWQMLARANSVLVVGGAMYGLSLLPLVFGELLVGASVVSGAWLPFITAFCLTGGLIMLAKQADSEQKASYIAKWSLAVVFIGVSIAGFFVSEIVLGLAILHGIIFPFYTPWVFELYASYQREKRAWHAVTAIRLKTFKGGLTEEAKVEFKVMDQPRLRIGIGFALLLIGFMGALVCSLSLVGNIAPWLTSLAFLITPLLPSIIGFCLAGGALLLTKVAYDHYRNIALDGGDAARVQNARWLFYGLTALTITFVAINAIVLAASGAGWVAALAAAVLAPTYPVWICGIVKHFERKWIVSTWAEMSVVRFARTSYSDSEAGSSLLAKQAVAGTPTDHPVTGTVDQDSKTAEEFKLSPRLEASP